MKKSMYSLMLAEDVIRAVDKLAAEQGTNRSNMVNQILAEHVSLVTPEKHVGHIFDVIEELMGGRGDYRLYAEPNSLTMSIKSVLRYHYRPTIRYEVEMDERVSPVTFEIDMDFLDKNIRESDEVYVSMKKERISLFSPEGREI